MRQKFGQNFLIDGNVARNIISAAELTKDDIALEIGPGKGILTKIIAPIVKKLIVVEIDNNLANKLIKDREEITDNGALRDTPLSRFAGLPPQGGQITLRDETTSLDSSSRGKDNNGALRVDPLPDPLPFSEREDNIAIINADFLKLDIEQSLFSSFLSPLSSLPFSSSLPLKIVSNLPYNVGTAIVQKILPLPFWSSAVFMLQKEVAQRLCAHSGAGDYGYISIFRAFYADCQMLFDVSPRCFAPQPKVVSSVIRLVNKMPANAPDPLFFPFIKHCFSMRRKTILNCISSFNGIEKPTASAILQNAQINPMLRPEKLSIDDFTALTLNIKKYI
ncbi:MAG: 16S rRNA (adenine(1518)-N(6)/adenine(1519)-N(6))-dimethyltransferase [Endomicrobium sp.]|jgi:16S rRNA (adenine1518-N6/adenine1519-N6)-dimethyltransferase|nr:16S rRNA (adenine(1518)-N(6)/adenine(1519)-N(6))-dimethyltransferase [Endomicrobium sp.]